MKHLRFLIYSALFLCFALLPVVADEQEAYTRVLDKLTSVRHFSDRPVLFVVGFDTSKSMSVEFDRSKKLTQTILSRYAAPGDSVYIFGFADKPSVLTGTNSPKQIPVSDPDKEISSLNEALLSLPRSSAKGTVFGRAKLFSLEKMKEFGAADNTIVLLFSDNNSEIEMGTNERERLKSLESSVATTAETIPLYSEGVSPLWLTIYTNSFPNSTPLAGPDGETNLDNPRLAWAARRVGSQTLQFIAPSSSRIEGDSVDVTVQFLGSSEPKSATITLDGKDQKESSFTDGRASWTIGDLKPGSHVLFVQAVLADGKVRTAEKNITVALPAPVTTPSPTPEVTPVATATPQSTPVPEPVKKEKTSFPFVPFLLLIVAGAAIYFFSLKPIKVRVIGPDSEESFQVPKGKSIRLGGTARVESDLLFKGELDETIASVRCLSFGKAKVFVNPNLRQGEVDIETDEGYSVGESGEPLLTSATVTFTNERGHKQVFTLVKEEASGPGAEEAEHFGSGSGSGEETTSDADWRS